MNGLGLHACRFAHTLGGTSRRSRQQHAQAGFFQGRDNSLCRGRLTRTGAAGQHHDLGRDGLSDSRELNFVVFDAGFRGEGRRVEKPVEQRTARTLCQISQATRRTALGMVERRKVNGLLVENKVFGLKHPCKGVTDSRFARFKKLPRSLYQLFLPGVDMSFVRKLSQRIEDAAPAPSRVLFLIAHLCGDAVGGLEADAPDIVGKAVGIFFHLVDTLLAVFPVDFRRIGRAYAIALQKEHDVLDVLLLLPALPDLRHTLTPDIGDFVEPFDVGFDDVDRFRSEPLDDSPGEPGADAFDQSAAEVFFDPVHRGGHRLLPRCGDELAAVAFVHLPFAAAQKNAAHRNLQQVTHERDKVAITLHLDLQHRVTVLGILIGNAFHDAAQKSCRVFVHKADDTEYPIKLRKKSRNSNAAGHTIFLTDLFIVQGIEIFFDNIPMTGIRLAEASHAFAFQSMDTLTKFRIGTQASVKITAVAVRSSTAAHARQQPKRIPEIIVFAMAGTADVNIACCITNVYHFSSFHDIKF